MTLMFRVSHDFLLTVVGDGLGRIFFFENEAEIIMYRHLEGFLLKAIYMKGSDEDTLIFIERNLHLAVKVIGAENDPEMMRAMKTDTNSILRDILWEVRE